MSHEITREEDQERAALYALGALCQHEARAFEYQLREGDPQLQSDLESFEKVVEAIGYGAPTAEPSAFLLEVLKNRLEKVDQLQAPTNLVPNVGNTAVPKVIAFQERSQASTAQKPAQSTRDFPAPTSIESRRKARASVIIPWAIAASLIVCSIVAVLAWRQTRQESDSLKSQIAAIQDQTEQMRQQVIATNGKVLEHARINQVLMAAGHRVIDMGGFDGAPNSSGKIFWDTKAREWAVVANLPPAPEGKVYQLWFVTTDARISAGLIKTDSTGHAFTVVNVPPDITNLGAAAITLEPAGGSAQPTMPIYTIGKVS